MFICRVSRRILLSVLSTWSVMSSMISAHINWEGNEKTGAFHCCPETDRDRDKAREHLHYLWTKSAIDLFPTSPCGYGVVKYARWHCLCHKRQLSSLGPPPQGEGVQICPTPTPLRCGTADAEIKGLPLMGAQGYQRFPLSKPFHAVPAYRASIYLVSAFLASFSPNFSNPQQWKVYLSSEA